MNTMKKTERLLGIIGAGFLATAVVATGVSFAQPNDAPPSDTPRIDAPDRPVPGPGFRGGEHGDCPHRGEPRGAGFDGPGGPRGPMGPPPRFEEIDQDGDGKLSETEASEIPPVQQHGFPFFDENADGFLSERELPPPPPPPGGMPPAAFEDLDKNGDGNISRDEFQTHGPRHMGRPPHFEDADANSDGKLSPEEAADIPPVAHRGFEAWDNDGDGFLTREELPPPPHMAGGRGGMGPGPDFRPGPGRGGDFDRHHGPGRGEHFGPSRGPGRHQEFEAGGAPRGER